MGLHPVAQGIIPPEQLAGVAATSVHETLSEVVGEYVTAHEKTIRRSNRRLQEELGVDLVDANWLL